jgi:hypothetical protein
MEEEVRQRKGDEEEKNKIKITRQPKEERAQCYIKRTQNAIGIPLHQRRRLFELDQGWCQALQTELVCTFVQLQPPHLVDPSPLQASENSVK